MVPSLTVSVAPYEPGELYVTTGFCNVEVAGVPPGKDHDQLVTSPVELSENCTGWPVAQYNFWLTTNELDKLLKLPNGVSITALP